MDEARRLIDMVEAPVRHFVEEIDGTRLVHGNLTVSEEILVLFHSFDPVAVPKAKIDASLSRRSFKSVANRLSELERGKLIQKTSSGFRLTIPGHAAAVDAIKKLT
jgi:RIO-like serine/threonine protein kinase